MAMADWTFIDWLFFIALGVVPWILFISFPFWLAAQMDKEENARREERERWQKKMQERQAKNQDEKTP